MLVGVLPWTQAGLGESLFVRVFAAVGIPAAAAVMNFVVLTAALSSMNCNLYLTSRMLFSLARSGYAPAALGRLGRQGTPVAALAVSSCGMVAALLLERRFQQTAYLYMLGAAFFGGLYVWMMIFLTHLAFRRRRAVAAAHLASPVPRFGWAHQKWSSLAGLLVLSAVLVSTWWIPGMRITLAAGVPWLVFISLCYLLWAKLNGARRT